MFGKADPYCKIVIGAQEFSTRPHKVRAVAVGRVLVGWALRLYGCMGMLGLLCFVFCWGT